MLLRFNASNSPENRRMILTSQRYFFVFSFFYEPSKDGKFSNVICDDLSIDQSAACAEAVRTV